MSIFDADRPFEWPHDKAYALITDDDYIVVDSEGEKHYVEITLKESIGGNDYQLQCSYDASKMADYNNNYAWTFDNGKSAGVCVEDGQFFIADTSDLAKRFSCGILTVYLSKVDLNFIRIINFCFKCFEENFYNYYRRKECQKQERNIWKQRKRFRRTP